MQLAYKKKHILNWFYISSSLLHVNPS